MGVPVNPTADSPRPVPCTTDHDTAGWFEATSRGAIAVRVCASCDRVLHLPIPCCPSCGSTDTGWRDVAPQGTVYASTVVAHQLHPAFPTPYTLVLTELRDVPGVRFVSHLEGRHELPVGTPVHAVFDDVRTAPDGSSVVVPRWLPDVP